MSEDSRRTSVIRQDDPCTAELPPVAPAQQPAASRIDWRAARRAERACCCIAKPMVIAVLPPRPGRPHDTELLLCGHHYRMSRQALAAAGATLLNLDGEPVTADPWSYQTGATAA
jgi:hypothetical protein